MNLVVRAEQQSLWLCFEPWANEYMPEFPADLPVAALKHVIEIIPPIRSEPDRLD
ncbi:hypothetical protein [Lentzea aerocolonigenes]|uniref:hypothetical protein n=1 Tax=Lentzea aerocolonigenes TaxID=68170 RepID=UPI000AB50506|nr:hypothetical protein [Lentzea aerocolonigenes]